MARPTKNKKEKENKKPTKKNAEKKQTTPTKMFACRRGCNELFKYRTQLVRHKLKCNLISPQKPSKGWKKVGADRFECESCHKLFPWQTSVSRHVTTCNSSKSNSETKDCIICERTFKYSSDLARHLKSHKKKGEMMVPSFVCSTSVCDDMMVPLFACGASYVGDNDSSRASTSSFACSASVYDNDSTIVSTSTENTSTFNESEAFDFSISSLNDEETARFNSTKVTDVIENDNPIVDPAEFTGVTPAYRTVSPATNAVFPEHVYPNLIEDDDDDDPIVDPAYTPESTEVTPANESCALPENNAFVLPEDVAPNVVIEGTRKWKDILAYTDATGTKEADMYQCLIRHLKSLAESRKGREQFNTLLVEIFGFERLQDPSFIYFLSNQLGKRYRNLKWQVDNWIAGGLKGKRGHQGLSLETKQAVYDAWIEHTVASTDNRNNRVSVNISRREYLQRYDGIDNKDIVVEEKVTKRGRKIMSANRMIVTETIRSLQKSLLDKGIIVSYGSVLNLKPFFVTYASEKEMALCLCKICLNTKFLFDALMSRAKKDGDECFESITAFLMASSSCPKGENGYHTWSCSTGKCKQCNNLKPAPLKCSTSDDQVTVDQFEQVVREYEKVNAKTNKKEKKKTKVQERVSKQMSYKDLYQRLCNLKKEYCTHKYLVYNDKHHWPRILATVSDLGPIYHMDYSENMAQMHKFEVQSAHFNKRNYSLHCTVEHVDVSENPYLKSPYIYHYHLSDAMRHDFAFTSEVMDRCIRGGNLPQVIRMKSDNCSMQYKCGNTFHEYIKLAKKYSRTFIKYYGPSGHGKGLVDAMSEFGVKSPLLKAVIAINFKYNSSKDIYNLLLSLFPDDTQKKYSVIDVEDIESVRSGMAAVPIKGSRSYHMMSFKPDGTILCKVNMCSCNDCLLGNFLDCVIEPGKIFRADLGEEDEDSDIEYEDQDAFGEDIHEVMEKYELRSISVLEVVDEGDVVALYSHTNFEQFYLCKVVKFGVAEEQLRDGNNHVVEKGFPYLQVHYYEVKSNIIKKPNVIYRCLPKLVYVLPTQVMFPKVNVTYIGSDIHVARDEYQWLCDSC